MDSLTANLILQNQNSALVEGERSLNCQAQVKRSPTVVCVRCLDNPWVGGAQ